ncbi:glycosyltransferase family 2 protein [Paracoccus aerodenitrificans]|uniref:glycosyltransferase family 2 protein n=1 Tax=Paracoccus aerodenitrificans TaxID=3017781 RepID=UPI0022F0163E|nr:glycosyltransferase family 2 protein [Paracoccus aerodenitrificans]WBU65421.1 glycosyltransferase family 2 protein [Paracoccus aerodenitrificans]
MRHILLSSVKDEGPFLLEFVAHHRVLGFDAHHFASNDCSDGSDLLLDALAAHGVVTHTRSKPKPGEVPQHKGYRRIRRAYDIQSADWIMVLDADEFLMIDRGDRRVADLTALAGPEIDLITLNPMNFGTGDSPDWQPGRVASQFTRRLPVRNRANGPVKSLSRGHDLWQGMHNHHPVKFSADRDICYMRGNAETGIVPNDGMPWNHLRFFKPDRMTHDIAWYNHYPIKSIDSYMLRRARGRGAVKLGEPSLIRHDEEYWTRFAGASVRDTRILDFYGEETEAEMARLLSLPGVAEAQAEAERRYAAQIAAIADDPEP